MILATNFVMSWLLTNRDWKTKEPTKGGELCDDDGCQLIDWVLLVASYPEEPHHHQVIPDQHTSPNFLQRCRSGDPSPLQLVHQRYLTRSDESQTPSEVRGGAHLSVPICCWQYPSHRMSGPWGPKDDNDDVNLAKLYYRKSATKRKKEMVPAKEQTRKVCVCVLCSPYSIFQESWCVTCLLQGIFRAESWADILLCFLCTLDAKYFANWKTPNCWGFVVLWR